MYKVESLMEPTLFIKAINRLFYALWSLSTLYNFALCVHFPWTKMYHTVSLYDWLGVCYIVYSIFEYHRGYSNSNWLA